MSKKLMSIVCLSAALSMGLSFTAMAGTWKRDGRGWWYDRGNATYPTNTWEWIDGNNDGVAECYYFDASGYMLAKTKTPDGYEVNDEGQWIVRQARFGEYITDDWGNKVIQTKSISNSSKEKFPIPPSKKYTDQIVNKGDYGYYHDTHQIVSIWSNSAIIDRGSYYEIPNTRIYEDIYAQDCGCSVLATIEEIPAISFYIRKDAKISFYNSNTREDEYINVIKFMNAHNGNLAIDFSHGATLDTLIYKFDDKGYLIEINSKPYA